MDSRSTPLALEPCCCGRAHFTERELGVLQLIAAGCTNREAAMTLHVSIHTVTRQMTMLLRRADVPNRTALLTRAFQAGILTPGALGPELTGRRCIRPLGAKTPYGADAARP